MTKKLISRRNTLKLSALALGGVATSLFTPALLLSPAFAKSVKDIDYGPNRLDIYQPDNAQNAPMLVYVHGGAWKMGSRSGVQTKAKHFNRKGYVFASVGYTLYPGADAERQAQQVAQAVNWIHQNAENYGGNRGRIALMGHSAGCHLASLATLSGATNSVKALICNDTGAYDLQYLADINGGRLPRLYSALNKKEKWDRWSPIKYVGRRRQPPALVVWSGGRNRDKISKRFANALEAAGNNVSRFDGRKYSHLSINSSVGRSPDNAVTRAIDLFLARTV